MRIFIWTFAILSTFNAVISLKWFADVLTDGRIPERTIQDVIIAVLCNAAFAVWGFVLLGSR